MNKRILYRWMEPAEIDRLREIDRAEIIRLGYFYRDSQLKGRPVNWDTQGFTREGTGDHSFAGQIDFCRGHIQAGAKMIGAFDGNKMVAVGVLRPEIRPGLAQLAYLQVSNGYRRQGIASLMVEKLFQFAVATGADRVYVSATPTGSAVGFYMHHGFSPVKQPLPELYAMEPDDIHMVKNLQN
jgi:ribosomal protein S18 acetylase RimI-like enzyme